VNGDWTPFDLDTVKLLMSIFDTDRSGTVSFDEFAGLWKYIKDWQGVFRNFDRDQSGTIEGQELDAALRQFGFNMTPNLIRLLSMKYGTLPGPGNRTGGITFDRFVRCCVVVKSLTEAFQKHDPQQQGRANLDYYTFMEIVLQCP